MFRYSKLSNVNTRRRFDPANEEDLKQLRYYLDNNKWIGPCPFYVEDDWDNIPIMCLHKYAMHTLVK